MALASKSKLLFATRSTPAPKIAAEFNPPQGAPYAPTLSSAPALSPDGTKLAFIAGNERERLWVRDLPTGKVVALDSAGPAFFPFWSPDSKQLAFFGDGKLKKVALDGGPVQVLCDAPEGRGGSWSPRGLILFTPNIEEALYTVSQGGGTPQKLTELPKPGWTHRNPYFLPDGEHFLFIAREPTGASVGSLYAGSLKGGQPKLVLQAGSNVQYSGGYLLYLREGNLVAQPFDLSSLQITGEPIPLAEKLDYWNARDVAAFAAANGVLVYRQASVVPSQPVWVDASGKELERVGHPGVYRAVKVSPDGSKLGLLREQGANSLDVWTLDVKRNTLARATFAEAPLLGFAYSSDGNRMAVTVIARSTTKSQGWLQSASGSAQQEKLELPTEWSDVSDWSRDGRYLFATVQNNTTREDIYYIDLQGDRKPQPFVQTPRSESGPAISPNGKWLAYQSDESGGPEVYVTAFPGPGGKWQMSSGGGTDANWSADGKQLYFRQGDKLMSVAIQNLDALQFSSPVELPFSMKGVEGYAPAATPGQFVLLKHTGESQGSPMQVMLNWAEGLKE